MGSSKKHKKNKSERREKYEGRSKIVIRLREPPLAHAISLLRFAACCWACIHWEKKVVNKNDH